MRQFFRDMVLPPRGYCILRWLPLVVLGAPACAPFLWVALQGKTWFAFDLLLSYLPWSSYNPGAQPHNTLISDPINIFYTAAHVFKQGLRNGEIALWDPTRFCGTPALPPCHPLTFLLYALLPLTAAHDVLLWYCVISSGLFMYAYLRELGLQRTARYIGSFSWMFNGYVLVWLEFENVPAVAMAFAFVMFAIDFWIRRKDRFSFVVLVSSFALSLATMCSQLVIYEFLFAGVYLLYRCRPKRSSNGHLDLSQSRLLPVAALGFILAAIVSANFFILHLQMGEGGQRNAMEFNELLIKTGQLPLRNLITLVFPDFFGSPVIGTNLIQRRDGTQPYNNYNELCAYLGIVPLFLCAGSLAFLRRRHVGFYAAVSLCCLLMALGTIAYYPLARFVPGLNYSTPTRILFLFGFCCSILAALVAENFLAKDRLNRRWLLWGPWVLISVVSVALAAWMQTSSGLRWAAGLSLSTAIPNNIRTLFALPSATLLTPLLLLAGSLAVLVPAVLSSNQFSRRRFLQLAVALMVVDLMSFGFSYNTVSPRSWEYPLTPGLRIMQSDSTKYRALWIGNFLHNGLSPAGIEEVGGYASFYPKRYGEYLYAAQTGRAPDSLMEFSRWVTIGSFGSLLFDALNVKYLLLPPSAPVPGDLELVHREEMCVYKNPRAMERAFFVPAIRSHVSASGVLRDLVECDTGALLSTVFLEAAHPFVRQADASRELVAASVKITNYRYNSVDLRVETPAPGFVILSDSYHPAWTATINGERTPVLRANYVMRAVEVSAGSHSIVFRYRPRAVITGMILGAVGWILLAGTLLWLGLFGRRRHLTSPERYA